MGCDIHLFLERKTAKGWIDSTPYVKDDFDNDIRIQDHYTRCYMLFGILAGVRYHSGPNIAFPRGIPENCCQEYKNFVEEWQADGHNHSFFTVDELITAAKKYTGDAKGELEEFIRHIMKMIDVVNPYAIDYHDYTEYRVCFFFDN